MDELREVALAYYDNSTPELQGKAQEFFKSMDTNGDNRISPRELRDFLRQSGYDRIITDSNIFAKLDRNGDRGLDFQEVLTFYYIIKTAYVFCRVCRTYLSGSYFTCFDCFERADPSTTYDLCIACHSSKRFTHNHSHFLENHIMLNYKRGPDINMAMDDQYEAAIKYYNDSTQEVKKEVWSFFQSMAPTPGLNQVSYAVFNDFLQRKKYNWIINDPNLFNKLDRNRDGALDFWELLTFYYIISTRYFHCRNCQVYLNSMYFTCVACFDGGAPHHHHHHHRHSDPGTYNLCVTCYRKRSYISHASQPAAYILLG